MRKVFDYYKKQDHIEKQKQEIEKKNEEHRMKNRTMLNMKEEMFNKVRTAKEDMEQTKLNQLLKKNEQTEMKVNKYITQPQLQKKMNFENLEKKTVLKNELKQIKFEDHKMNFDRMTKSMEYNREKMLDKMHEKNKKIEDFK